MNSNYVGALIVSYFIFIFVEYYFLHQVLMLFNFLYVLSFVFVTKFYLTLKEIVVEWVHKLTN